MGKVGYNPFEGWSRLFASAQQIDANAGMVLVLHAALEREMDHLLAKQIVRPDKLRGLGFSHKISLIAATWKGDPAKADLLYNTLYHFNEVRNAIAHGDRPERIRGVMNALRGAHEKIGKREPDTIEMLNIACDICAFMGDGTPPLAEFAEVAEGMERVMQKWSEAFAYKG